MRVTPLARKKGLGAIMGVKDTRQRVEQSDEEPNQKEDPDWTEGIMGRQMIRQACPNRSQDNKDRLQ